MTKRNGMSARVKGWKIVEENLIETISRKESMVSFMRKTMEEVSGVSVEEVYQETAVSSTVIRRVKR